MGRPSACEALYALSYDAFAEVDMEIHQFAIARSRLDQVEPQERTAFLLLGHFMNQAAILSKWGAWCKPYEAANGIERDGRVAQSMLVLSSLAAKLNEGWELVN